MGQELNNIALDRISEVAAEIVDNHDHTILLIKGEMGSGKTTLIREICRLLEVKDNVASPTFSLVNEYASNRGPIYHFDFYRLKSIEEALDAGLEEYLYSGNLCLLEWPEIVESILPSGLMSIEIYNAENNQRNYKLTYHEPDQAHRL